MVALVQSWREVWSREAGTTSALAPFGVVTLAAGGSEGHGQNMAGLRWSQTGNYGVLPNAAMPATFVAQGYDLGDPMAGLRAPCFNETSWDPATCRPWNASAWNPALRPLNQLVWANAAPPFMGGIHPRLKSPVGRRLALAAARLFFGSAGAPTGPTLAGCRLDAGSAQLTLQFNTTLLRGEVLTVQPFDTNVSAWAYPDSSTAMVCYPPSPAQAAACLTTPGMWAPAPVRLGSAPGTAVLALANVSAAAVRYAWPLTDHGDTCCPGRDVAMGHAACIPGSCPLLSSPSYLPANPFYAALRGNRCVCTLPQTCDA